MAHAVSPGSIAASPLWERWRRSGPLGVLAAIVAALVLVIILGLILKAAGAWPVTASSDDMRIFLFNTLNGLTAGAVYFLVASGFTLIFGLLRVTNLAHGSFYLLGGYLAWSVWNATNNWVVGMLGGALILAVIGVVTQQALLRPLQNDIPSHRVGALGTAFFGIVVGWSLAHYGDVPIWLAAVAGLVTALLVGGFFLQQSVLRITQGRDLREALITIGFSIVAADLMLAHYGGLSYSTTAPDAINGATTMAWLSNAMNAVFQLHMDPLIYPSLRLFVLGLAAAILIALSAMLNMTRLGMIVRAAIDDRAMVSALGINIQIIFALLFALGAALAGLAGGIESTLTSVTTGDDGSYLLWSLIVVIIGGMGSLGGAAIGAVLVGLVYNYGLAYSPTNSSTVVFLLMVLVLAVRPQGLLGRPA